MLALFTGAWALEEAQSPSPERLKAEIGARGARTVLSEVYDHPSKWPQVFDGIARGEPGWLEVATLLRPSSDAGSAEDLDQAVAEALLHAPRAVLQLLATSGTTCDGCFDAEAVCGNYEASYRRSGDASPDALLRWLHAQETAVRKVGDRNLRKVGARCLDSIRSARATIKDPCFGKGPSCSAR